VPPRRRSCSLCAVGSGAGAGVEADAEVVASVTADWCRLSVGLKNDHGTSCRTNKRPAPGNRKMKERRDCTCGGANENCMFCFGTGIIVGPKSIPSCTGAPGSLQRNRAYGRRSRPLRPCPICGALVGRLQRHLNKAHGKHDKPAPEANPLSVAGSANRSTRSLQDKVKPRRQKRQQTKPHAGPVASPQQPSRPEANPTAVRPEKLQNDVLQQKLSRALDATKNFAHNFREQGRYGSHPSHDDFSDEGNP
jgi:hypothetical protein